MNFQKESKRDSKGLIPAYGGELKELIIKDEIEYESPIKMANKISKVELLGDFLRKGQFENLFNLVGVINQSDPKQIYLKDAEKIYSQKFIDNKNIRIYIVF